MGLFSKLFGKKENKQNKQTSPTSQPIGQNEAINNILSQQKQHFDSLVAGKTPAERISEKQLFEIFATYFMPNKQFYTGSDRKKYDAYFNAVNSARDEMLKQPGLFEEATKWKSSELADLINDPKPGLTNMMICGLIFCMGNYAVIKDAVYCVDFSELIPNCVALYLLLIAQKEPADKRKQLIDAGDRANKEPLQKALDALKVCDPNWNYMIW